MALRLVHLEDDPNDRALVADVLRCDGLICSVASASSREAFEAALADPPLIQRSQRCGLRETTRRGAERLADCGTPCHHSPWSAVTDHCRSALHSASRVPDAHLPSCQGVASRSPPRSSRLVSWGEAPCSPSGGERERVRVRTAGGSEAVGAPARFRSR